MWSSGTENFSFRMGWNISTASHGKNELIWASYEAISEVNHWSVKLIHSWNKVPLQRSRSGFFVSKILIPPPKKKHQHNVQPLKRTAKAPENCRERETQYFLFWVSASTPEDEHGIKEYTRGKGKSSSKLSFSGSMFIFRGVFSEPFLLLVLGPRLTVVKSKPSQGSKAISAAWCKERMKSFNFNFASARSKSFLDVDGMAWKILRCVLEHHQKLMVENPSLSGQKLVNLTHHLYMFVLLKIGRLQNLKNFAIGWVRISI